jgi:ribosome recycling factor
VQELKDRLRKKGQRVKDLNVKVKELKKDGKWMDDELKRNTQKILT